MRKMVSVLLAVAVGITAALGAIGCKKEEEWKDEDWIDTYCIFSVPLYGIREKVYLRYEKTVEIDYNFKEVIVHYDIYRVYRGDRILKVHASGEKNLSVRPGMTKQVTTSWYRTKFGSEFATLNLVIRGEAEETA